MQIIQSFVITAALPNWDTASCLHMRTFRMRQLGKKQHLAIVTSIACYWYMLEIVHLYGLTLHPFKVHPDNLATNGQTW